MAKPMKYSKQRETLLALLKASKSHPTADWLYQELRKEFTNISLGTVYRNLNQLTDAGKIIKLDTGHGCEHYDACTQNHYHFVCEECACVQDVDMDELDAINQLAQKASGNDISSHSLIFFGKCSACRNKAIEN